MRSVTAAVEKIIQGEREEDERMITRPLTSFLTKFRRADPEDRSSHAPPTLLFNDGLCCGWMCTCAPDKGYSSPNLPYPVSRYPVCIPLSRILCPLFHDSVSRIPLSHYPVSISQYPVSRIPLSYIPFAHAARIARGNSRTRFRL